MTVKLNLSAIESIIGKQYIDNKEEFCKCLKEYGLRHSPKSLKRAIDNDKLGQYIPFPTLVEMCENKYPLAMCFTFINDNGSECHSHFPKIPNSIPILSYNLLKLSTDFAYNINLTSNLRKIFNNDIDIIELANNNLDALQHVASTHFIEALLCMELDFNDYFFQDNFKMPFQHKRDIILLSEDICSNEIRYLRSYLEEKEKVKNFSLFIKDKRRDFTMFTENVRRKIENPDLLNAINEIEMYFYNNLRYK